MVSVIIPTYDIISYSNINLNSVLKQNYLNCESIFIKSIFSTIFQVKYNQIEELKEKTFKSMKETFKFRINDDKLYNMMKENINNILEFFKFDDIVGELVE